MDDPDGTDADLRHPSSSSRNRMSRTSRNRMGNGYGHEPVDDDGDSYYSGVTSPGPYRRPSMARSSSSIIGDVEMAQDEVSRADW